MARGSGSTSRRRPSEFANLMGVAEEWKFFGLGHELHECKGPSSKVSQLVPRNSEGIYIIRIVNQDVYLSSAFYMFVDALVVIQRNISTFAGAHCVAYNELVGKFVGSSAW